MAEYHCKECDKEFSSKEALEMHNRSKHFHKVKEPVDIKKYKKWFVFGAIIILVVLGAYAYSVWQDQPGKYDDFAQCLTDSGAKMYGAYWCSHCNAQKQLFGKSFSYVNYIECSLPNQAGQTEFCNEAGIESYPTWEFGDESRVSGEQSLENLAARTGCVLG